MGRSANVAFSSLSQADAGYTLPTAEMVEAYVRACDGGDDLVREMERRRRRAKAEDLARQGEHVRPLAARGPLEVGGFRLWARLGAGAMGQVYLGERGDGDVAAVKLIRPELADDPLFRRRFAHEVRALADRRQSLRRPVRRRRPRPRRRAALARGGLRAGPSLRDAARCPRRW